MRSVSACFVFVGCLVVLTGCAGKSRADHSQLGNEAGGNGGGAAGAGGAGMGSAGMGAAAAGGQPAICQSFVDAKPHSVPVLIRNDGKVAIHLGPRLENCAETPLFLVRDASGNVLTGPGRCRTPCESLLAGDPVGGCPAVCPVLKAVTLQPGETISVDWAGLFGVQDDLPSECVPKRADGLEFGTQCEHLQAIAAGTYTFSAEAGTTLDCSQILAEGCAKCMPDADGYCTTPYALVGGSRLMARVEAEFDARGQADPVELVFRD